MDKKIKKLLDNTKNKNSKAWSLYREKKNKIESRRLSRSIKNKKIDELLNKTRSQISYNWRDYRGKRYTTTHKSGIYGLVLDRRKKHKSSDERFYSIRKNSDTEKIFDNIKELNKVRYILVVLKIRMDESGSIHFISDSFTLLRFEKIPSDQIINNVIEKFQLRKRYEGFTLLKTSIRIIYEGTKKTKKV